MCFIGVGSIALRHMKNLNRICKERDIELWIDACRHSVSAVPCEYARKEYYDLLELPDDYDAIFITNPTSKHIEAIKSLKNKTKAFFVEKPVCDINQISSLDELDVDEGKVVYVACPLRYNPVIQFIKQNVDSESVLSVRCISSSYLPDWRQGKDYRETYSAHRELGGGVSIDLIHEWDYITYLFGFPDDVKSFIGKKSSLEIDSDDFATYLGLYKSMIAELHLDYFGRKTIRLIELFTRDDTIIGDIAGNTIEYMVSGEKHIFDEDRDGFQIRELETFLDILDGKERNENALEHAKRVLSLTQGEKVE